MPIIEADPWRAQYFEGVACPPEVQIPTDDVTAFKLNPRHRWVYDKLQVVQSQGLLCATHDVSPFAYPVFSKPATNLRGMGQGSRVLRNRHEFAKHRNGADFWMEVLTGPHISTDWAVVRGETHWCRHTQGIPGPGGTFDYWIIEPGSRPTLEDYSRDWIRRHLPDYTGMLNIETIGGYIIEAHLRLTDQWPDLYGRGWLDAVVRLYQEHRWAFSEGIRTEAYSVVLFGPHGVPYIHPSAAREAAYRDTRGVSSVQITFHRDRPLGAHAMPPGGFRVAIINCQTLAAGLRLRSTIERDFGLQDLRRFGRVAGNAHAGNTLRPAFALS